MSSGEGLGLLRISDLSDYEVRSTSSGVQHACRRPGRDVDRSAICTARACLGLSSPLVRAAVSVHWRCEVLRRTKNLIYDKVPKKQL